MKTTLSEAVSPPLVEGGERKTINSELWHACAGPLVSLPAIGSIVYYFPQGHVEQVAASTQKVAETHIPNYPNPPSQLLCQLHNVTLHADLETDEVYAQMTLQPVNTYNKDALLASDLGLKQGKQPTEFFCKTLTASDTSTHGGFSVPRRAAEKVFPALDYTAQPPAQELVARDLHDKLWTFRHIYRGQPKRHLLTTGWSVFVSSKRLLAGDSVLFIRDEKGQLLLGIRRANRQPTSMPLSVLSSDSMHIGVLAAAAHAAANQSPFTVFYNPRTSLSEFVVPLAKYNKALYGTQVSIGMRFRMMFETEESSVRRYMGTITGISDLDSLRWPNSQWRNLQVGWDETGAGEKQNRVSVWEIETVATPFFICPPFFRFKRPLLPGEDTEIEAPSSKLPFPWLREENDILDFQNPVSTSGLDNLMGLQQRNGISNPSVDLFRSMGSNTLQDLRGNDASKEVSVSQQASQTRDIQQLGLSPLQDFQSQLLLQQIQQQMQNSQQHMPSQISLQQLQQNLLPQNILQPAQQSQMLQKLHQQSQQKLQQQFQQSNLQQKLTPQVHQNVPLQHTENQLQQQLTQAQQNSLHLPPLQQQLLLQSLMNQQQVPLPRVDQMQQMVPNLKMSQNQTLRDLQELQTKEDLTKQPVVNGTIQQRILQMQTQQQSKMPSLTSQPLEAHPQNQQILLDHHSNLNQKQLSTSEQIQNHQSSISQQQSHRSTSEHSSYSHQQSPLISNHICDVEGQLLQSLSSRTNNSCSLPPQAKSESDMTEAEVSFCSAAISNIGSQMPSVISKQICGAVSDEKTRCSRLMKSATNNTHGHAPDQISNQPVSTFISSNKETCTTELKTIPNLLSAAIETQSVGVTTFMTAQPAQIPRSFSRVSNTLTPCWFGSATHDSDFQSDLRNSTLFGVSSESNLTDAAPSTLVSKECNMVKDIQACQLSADSIVSTLSTNNDIQPQLSSASILSSHSLGVQDLPDNSDVASTVEDNNFLQRASFQQPPPPPPMRTYTKVYKLGSVGRSIDVTRYKNYDELRYELARMFGLEGQLEDPRKTGWQLVYVDHESDILLVGDDPWEEFVSCVRYIKILSPQEVLQMSQEGMEIINTAPMQIQNATCSDDNHMWRDPHF